MRKIGEGVQIGRLCLVFANEVVLLLLEAMVLRLQVVRGLLSTAVQVKYGGLLKIPDN